MRAPPINSAQQASTIWPHAKAAKVSPGGLCRCVCMEVCRAERCSNVAQACQPLDAQLHQMRQLMRCQCVGVNVSPDEL